MGLAVLLFFTTLALADAPSKTDIGWFDDAARLKTSTEPLVPGVKATSLPTERRELCTRTQGQLTLAHLKPGHDETMALWALHDQLLKEQLAPTCADAARQTELSRLRTHIMNVLVGINEQDSLADNNPTGFFHTGMCWFHSRLQRAAMYVANFRPSLPKPTRAEAKELLRRLTRMDRVVEIPGYADLGSFTRDHKNEVEQVLDEWSFVTVPEMLVRVGDRGSTVDVPTRLARRAELVRRWEKNEDVLFLRFNWKSSTLGLIQHSKLVLKAEPIYARTLPLKRTGYRFMLKDPNATKYVTTVECDDAEPCDVIDYAYPSYDGDLEQLKAALKSYCSAS